MTEVQKREVLMRLVREGMAETPMTEALRVSIVEWHVGRVAALILDAGWVPPKEKP